MKRALFLILLLFSSVFAEVQQLKISQVQKVMHEIFEQHVNKKAMTKEVISHSFHAYIDHFDPERVYLLESEVAPFINLTDNQLDEILNDYHRGRYPKYQALNDVIQNAILRQQTIRENVFKNTRALIRQPKVKFPEGDKMPRFAKNNQELKERLRKHTVYFLQQEASQYPKLNVQQLLSQFDNEMRQEENHYLFLDGFGNPLNHHVSENLFALHLLKAFSASLDSHTRFFNSNEAYEMRVRLEKGFHGIGIVLQERFDGVVISRLIPGGPADKSGMIQKDDRIVEINGENVESKPLAYLSDRLRGEADKSIKLILERDGGKTVNIALNRELITLDDERVSSSFESYGNGIIGRITLTSFYQSENGISSEKDVKKAIQLLKEKGNLRGLILDLRENSGGFLNQAVKVAGLFITNGVIVVSKYSDGQERIYRDMDGKVSYSGPLIVLTSKATASAAEIVAQALQDWGVAIVVGDERTYGKGTIQSQTVTDDWSSSYFKVTVGKYYTVSGKTPQIQGVLADIVVPSQWCYDDIGEKYLEVTLNNDQIADAYADTLQDIDPSLREWYVRYYMPTLQKREGKWARYVEPLKVASLERMQKNAAYQSFIQSRASKQTVPSLQMAEAVNVMKDMIDINAQRFNPAIVEK